MALLTTTTPSPIPGTYGNLRMLLQNHLCGLSDNEGRVAKQALLGLPERTTPFDIICNVHEAADYRRRILEIGNSLRMWRSREAINTARLKDEAEILYPIHRVLIPDTYEDIMLSLHESQALSLLTFILEVWPLPKLGNAVLEKLYQYSGILPASAAISVIVDWAQLDHGNPSISVFRASYDGKDAAITYMAPIIRHRLPERHKTHQTLYRNVLSKWRALEHPFLLQFLGVDVVLQPGLVGIVSPWMPHGTARKYCTKYPQFVNNVLIEVALGLEYLHSQDVIHGDLRGTNIYIDVEKHVRVANFGIRDFFLRHDFERKPDEDSYPWTAPEFIFDGLKSSKMDVYAFGVLCVELYTQQTPTFPHRRTRPGFLTHILSLTDDRRPLRPSAIPDKLWIVIESCWKKEPSERPTMTEVVRMLESCSLT